MPIGFSRIRIAGFKSFAEPMTVEIAPGLTGIVGPNGCGKSNVVEALRWAMGESSARSLRGGEMDDVIFAGTANRPARNLAEVTLTLEALDTAFPAPFDGQSELEIGRRIERGSGSAYRVNGKEARARDVQTLFADMASGARSSAMVSQGRVGSLVNARPDERRSILEEAAGISGLHSRRHEADLKLRAAEANAARADDLRAQLSAQLAGLQKQARQANRYRNLSGLIRAAEAELLALQRARSVARRQDAHARLALAQHAASEAAEQAARLAEAAERASSVLQPLREAAGAARTALERHRLACEQSDAALAAAETALQTARAVVASLDRDRQHADRLRHDATTAEQRLCAEAEQLAAAAAGHPDREQAAAAILAEAEAAQLLADDRLQRATAECAAFAARGQALGEVLRQAEARARKAESSLAGLNRERDSMNPVDPARLAQAEAIVAACHDQFRDAGVALEQAEAARASAQSAHHTARARFHQIEMVHARLAAEYEALDEILGVHAGGASRLIDQLTVPAGLEGAIGAALGEELELPDDPGAARHMRVLPQLAGSEVLPPAAEPLASLIAAPPCLQRALSQIGLIATESGSALQSDLRPGQMLVSREGGLWRWDGYVQTAGAPTPAAVRLEQRNRLTELTVRLAAAAAERGDAQAEADRAAAQEREAVAREAAARATRRAGDQAFERAQRDHSALQREAEATAARCAALDGQIARLAAERDEAAEQLKSARAAAAGLPDQQLANLAIAQARAALTAARQTEQRARSTVDQLQREAAAREARQLAIGAERAAWADRLRDATARADELVARIAEARATEARREAEPARLEEARADAASLLDQAERTHAACVDLLQRAETEAAATLSADRAAATSMAAAREAVLRAEAECREADQAWGSIAERILEKRGVADDLPAASDHSEETEARARRKLDRLSREREEMGPVNLRAEIEAGEIEARLEAIERDRDELTTAINKLRGSIGHLNREGRERLETVFAEVDRHFQTLFTRMFGGGRAHLALVGSDDPLQAGLEIYAQPPGKKLATLSLLSGGEQALTALSLIFAVFRCNPAPVCVLDEVDAPLDDANIDRFCALLDDMVRQTGTRFLVVTHHHVTMARMDRLYGVTMQERGVSRLLSVDLRRAAELVEPLLAAAE